MRLVNAEILKLRKRRGTMVWIGALTVGTVSLVFSVMIALHAASPAHHSAAGGTKNFEGAVWLLASLGSVAAAILGTTAGSQDRSAGVFRDLVVSGTPRKRLFDVRLPGALAVLAPFIVAAFGIVVVLSYAFAGDHPTPGLHEVGVYGVSLGLLVLVNLVLGVSLGSVVSGRIATGVLIGWNAVVAPLLASAASFGGVRKFIDVPAASHWAPNVAGKVDVAMTGGTAITVVVIWIAVALRTGAFWTRRLDV